jgi:hypothetical protein
VDLYIHSTIRLHGVVLNLLSTGEKFIITDHMHNIRAGYDALTSHCFVDSNELNQLANQLRGALTITNV